MKVQENLDQLYKWQENNNMQFNGTKFQVLRYGPNKELKNDVIWPKVKKLIKDYKKFLTYDKKKCTIILNDFINQFYS